MVWIPDHIWKQQGNKIRIGGWRNNDKAGAKPGWKALPGLASAAKPWQKRAAKPPQNTVPANFPLDEARAYTGTVDAYGKLKGGSFTIDAKNVRLPGGAKIAVQDALDAGKTFVGGQYLRYTGKLKFYNPKRGFGYIAIDDGYAYDREGVPKEIRCERSEMNAGGSQPGYQKDVQVEFGIWVTQREQFKGYNVTLLGGAPLPAE
eukprot:TRINITY_DN10782_c0_g2_i2.p1 TRINITY_DN10782_c0_g2~~TRINITY_DN10782_c0_g2_i2.p1  ORF type:complete len:204 (-),score=43.68 TRINITY_DN10782_c0_g2_i2:214-825(-)